MALEPEVKAAAIAKLIVGDTPQQVSEEFDIPLSTVYVFNRKIKTQKEEAAVQTLVEAPIEVITAIAEETKAKAITQLPPKEATQAVEQIDAMVDGVEGLKKLDRSFQTTMTSVLSKFDKFLNNEDITLKEVKIISDTVADAYGKVFASGTNIHIGDNNDHSSKQLSVFQNKMSI